MIEISYRKSIPYSLETSLSQYFDYEHIEHVHPTTLGAYELVETLGNVIRYDQIWPRKFFIRRKSRVRQEFFPPDRIHFEFERGLYKGVQVQTVLTSTPEGTSIEETYTIPRLPNWNWLRRYVEKAALQRIEKIWEEDLGVDVCRDGWPGAPVGAGIPDRPSPRGTDRPKSDALRMTGLPQEGGSAVLDYAGEEVAVFKIAGRYCAISNYCPHAGGPLALGKVSSGCVACPWHGARFSLETGEVLSGPAQSSVKRFRAIEKNGCVEVSGVLN